jgi:D-inositol-3-phosphate glycosyltransferase
MARRDDIVAFADELLDVGSFPEYGRPGLQVVGADEVTKIVCGVSSSRELFERAGALGVGDRVHHVGFRDDVASVYGAADVVAVPSHNESFGLVALEAQACGTPVVATDVGGMPEAAGPAGLVVPPNAPAAFAAACVELLTDPGRRLALSTAGRRHALAHFTLDRFLGNVRDVYAEFTAPAAAPAAAVHIPAQRAARPDVPSLTGGRA